MKKKITMKEARELANQASVRADRERAQAIENDPDSKYEPLKEPWFYNSDGEPTVEANELVRTHSPEQLAAIIAKLQQERNDALEMSAVDASGSDLAHD